MGRDQRGMTRYVTWLLVVSLALGVPALSLAQSKPTVAGDTAQNLQVLPPWTMRLCPTALYATYGPLEAALLKTRDADCALWRTQASTLAKQFATCQAAAELTKKLLATYEAEQKLDKERNQALTEQLKKEIAEKNTYKYKPNYGWLYIAVGAALAVTGLAFGVGVWLGK